jgi:hypothetical protein
MNKNIVKILCNIQSYLLIIFSLYIFIGINQKLYSKPITNNMVIVKNYQFKSTNESNIFFKEIITKLKEQGFVLNISPIIKSVPVSFARKDCLYNFCDKDENYFFIKVDQDNLLITLVFYFKEQHKEYWAKFFKKYFQYLQKNYINKVKIQHNNIDFNTEVIGCYNNNSQHPVVSNLVWIVGMPYKHKAWIDELNITYIPLKNSYIKDSRIIIPTYLTYTYQKGIYAECFNFTYNYKIKVLGIKDTVITPFQKNMMSKSIQQLKMNKSKMK